MTVLAGFLLGWNLFETAKHLRDAILEQHNRIQHLIDFAVSLGTMVLCVGYMLGW